MRQQALILIAAVTLCTTATAQHAYLPTTLSFAKSCDISNINKKTIHHWSYSDNQTRTNQLRSSLRLSPQLNLVDLRSQLGSDMQQLRLQQRNQQWQGMFQGVMQNVRRPNTSTNKL